jgi:DMSO/TMAO reductase YedYZ molybdopterin-dependent catalytic subunit
MRLTRVQSPNLDKPWPPGQRTVDTFPVYDIHTPRPAFDPATFRLRVRGSVAHFFQLTWDELLALPAVEVEAHFHCVTTWSKERLVWTGVPARTIIERAQPQPGTVQVMARGLEGYTTNVPVAYLYEADTVLAYALGGAPLTPEHGAPLRLVVPQLYAWKSAKYLTSLVFQTEWHPGFWEERGYHLIGDPWAEQRYTEPLEKVRAWWRKVRITEVQR